MHEDSVDIGPLRLDELQWLRWVVRSEIRRMERQAEKFGKVRPGSGLARRAELGARVRAKLTPKEEQ